MAEPIAITTRARPLAGSPALLATALSSMRLPDGDVHAGIADVIEVARHFARDRIKVAGYWRRGAPGTHGMVDDQGTPAFTPDQ